MKTSMHKLVTLCIAAAICAVVTSAMAAVSNLESYHFRHDFSTGARVFTGGPNCPRDFITDTSADTVAVEGPNGPGSAMHIGQDSGPLSINGVQVNSDDSTTTKTTNLALNTNAWTLVMSFRPGNVEKGMLFSIGRLNGGKSSGRIAITVCSSSDPSKLYLQEFYRGADGSVPEKGNSVTLTGLSNMTNGFHTLVMVYSSSDKTVTPYVDGTKKTVLTLSSKTTTSRAVGNYFQYGSFPSITGNVSGFSRSYTNTDVAFYDLRFYFGAFNDSDARAYAALYPADRMGSPFRPSAYVESGATNAVADARNITTPMNYIDTGYAAKKGTEFVLDFQYLDWATIQQYAFGIWNGIESSTPTVDGTTHAFYINGNKGFAFARFSDTSADWHAITANNAADRLRHVVTVDNTDDASDTGSTATILNWADRSTMATASSTKNHAVDAMTNTYLFAVNTKGEAKRFTKARIYSFEADESGTPVLFLAPDTENGEAGVRDIITGTFHGDGNKNNNPERTLRFYDGVGRASDYKYEDSTLYAKLYATSDEKGTVSVADGAAAVSAEGWVPRGGTLALSAAASDSSQYQFNEWTGDTWAIADGFSKTNASIEVSTPYAVQLRATFKPTVDAQLTIAADGADAVNWSIADWRSADDPSVAIAAPVGKEVTVIAHKSVTLTLDADVSLSKFTVQADTNCVVTFALGTGGTFCADEVVVSNGVLKLGADGILGATPLVTVEDGGTFDFNGKVVGDGEAVTGNVVTEFHIAGAGAGDWPWALTSSADMTSSKNVGMLHLDANATVGGAKELWMGVRNGAGWNAANKNLNLNGFTLTKTGTGALQIRRPYSRNEGTIDVQSGSVRVTGWSNATAAYGESCVSNIALVVHEGVTAENSVGYPLYFKTLDCSGGALKGSSGGFGMNAGETFAGHGTAAGLTMADGAVATLDGNLDVTMALTAEGALSFVRKTGVETNVTVAATGTFTASNAITVGAGVVFNIGVNRPTGTLTVDDDATLVLRQANLDEDEIVVNASTQLQNIILYDVRGLLIQNPEVSYDADAGTVTVRAPTPVWTNADGTGSFSAAENWSSGAVPGEGRSFKMSLDGDTTVMLGSDYVFGNVQIAGTGSVGFDGAGSLTLAKVLLTNGVSFAACGRVTAAELDLPTGSTATLTTLDGVAAGGVTGVGTLVLAPGEAESVTISGLSSFTGDFSVTPDHSMTVTLTCAATSLKKFTLNGTTNVVFTLVKGKGGSFKASEAVVAGGVLQQGGDNVLGETPKITVQDGGTFDINAKTIRQETPIYIAGAGAGSWPWALASSAGAMASGNYLFDLYLTADATIGKGQFKIGRDDDESYIYLNGHTLTATSWLTLRNVNTKNGTIDLYNSATLNLWNNLNSQTKNRGTTLIVRQGHYVQNKTNRKISVSNLIMYGGSITDDNDTAQTFGIIDELRGHGTITKLVMESGAKFYPDGADYLTVTKTLSGTLKVDISDPALAGKAKIPLLKVPVALKNTADGAFDLTALPPGWQLQSKDDGVNVEYLIRNLGFSIFIR